MTLATLKDVTRSLRKRQRWRTHWDGCEHEHVDCAVIHIIEGIEEILLAADRAASATFRHQQIKTRHALRKTLNRFYAKWLLKSLRDSKPPKG